MTEPVLQLDQVTAGYGRRLVFRDLSLSVPAGSRVGIIGPNGSGKTTLFRIALGLIRPWQGQVRLFGRPPQRLNRRRYPVGFLPQVRNLANDFPILVQEVVLQGRIGRRGLFRWLGRSDRLIAEQALNQVGMSAFADRSFSALSGGQQQRVLLARALASEAKLIILDEPVTGIDTVTRDLITDILGRLAASGVAVLVSTHDLSPENLARFDQLVSLSGTADLETHWVERHSPAGDPGAHGSPSTSDPAAAAGSRSGDRSYQRSTFSLYPRGDQPVASPANLVQPSAFSLQPSTALPPSGVPWTS